MRRTAPAALAVLVSMADLLTGCGSSGTDAGAGPTVSTAPGTTAGSAAGTTASTAPTAGPTAPACPVDPVSVAVTVNQWADIAKSLGGACADTTAIITSSSVDPHDYEPTPQDVSTFTKAQLVVENGAGYDDWAGRALATARTSPAVVDAAAAAGVKVGDNPHVFYSPTFVAIAADAITAELTKLRPGAASYFTAANTAWKASLKPFDDELARVKAASSGKTFEATETVADHLAEAAGLTDVTPAGYRDLGDGDEPTPGDISAFGSALRSGRADVLFYNTQTQGAVPDQLRGIAEQAGRPVIDVTETVPEQFTSYQEWQLSVLRQIAGALGVN